MIKRLPFCLFVFVSLAPLSAAQEKQEPIEFERENWVIGLTGLSDKGISADSSYFLNSLPLLLYNEISDISEHRLGEAEIEEYSESLLREKLRDLEKEKTALHAKRDELLFSDMKRSDRKKEYGDLSSQIDEKGKEISLFSERRADDVVMPDSLPVILKELDEAEGTVLDLPREKAARFIRREDLDFFITGSLEQIDDLFFLTVAAYDRTDENAQLFLELNGKEEELEDLIRDAGRELRSLILGRTWSGVSIETVPRSALIMIDGESIAVGSALKRDLEPGFVTLKVSENGYITDNRQVYLPAEGVQELRITLEEGEDDSLFLFSDPPGADVYFGALWMGETPLFATFPDQSVQIEISKEEYMPFIISSDKLSGESLTVQLGTEFYDREIALKDAKSDFYRSLGWFSLSVGIPFVMAGIYQNLDNRYNNYAYSYSQTGNSDYYDKALDYKHQADIAYFAYWGGITLSSSLLVNVLFKLWNYLKAAEESTED